MEKATLPGYSFATKQYCLLTKPGIIFGNIITTCGGFALASRGEFHLWVFLATLLGLSLIIASSCVFNNYIDRHHDKKMARTKNRALATGSISTKRAIFFALSLGALGIFVMALWVNLISLGVALFGFFVYVLLYSFSKHRSMHGTLIGSVAGAVPPVVGYAAACNCLDLGALILFSMIALWQMPHFFAIAIYRLKDYTAASIPVLPVIKGVRHAKIQMTLYIIAFIGVSLLLTVFHYTGFAYLIITAALGVAWLLLCIQGFRSDNDRLWARKMFIFSLIVVLGICITIPFSIA